MLRTIKILLTTAAGMSLAASAWAFTLWGPTETWQTTAIDYQTRYWYSLNNLSNALPLNPGNSTVTELGGPKNFSVGTRLNTGVITYAFDQSFIKYFGPAGIKVVNEAFNILNALPQVSDASPDLSEFPTTGVQQINYSAQAMGMLDMKSAVLQIMMEHMGLLGETHVWDLGAAPIPLGPTCESEYFVIPRNIDPVTGPWSPYVNGVKYGYTIYDGCYAGVMIADAIETVNQVVPNNYTAVATYEGLKIGSFYTGLTRDDFGGLRYLMSQYNYSYEPLAGNTYAVESGGAWGDASSNAPSTAWEGVAGGVEKIQFVYIPYNPPISTNWGTNVVHWTLPAPTNGVLGQLQVTRSNTAPDIIFAAASLLGQGGSAQSDEPFTRTVTYLDSTLNPSGVATNQNVFAPAETIVFNDIGVLYENFNPGFLDSDTPFSTPFFIWGSYDGSTKPPNLLYTNSNIQALQEEVLQQSLAPVQTWAGILSTSTTASGTGGGNVAGGGGGGAGGAGGATTGQ